MYFCETGLNWLKIGLLLWEDEALGPHIIRFSHLVSYLGYSQELRDCHIVNRVMAIYTWAETCCLQIIAVTGAYYTYVYTVKLR